MLTSNFLFKRTKHHKTLLFQLFEYIFFQRVISVRIIYFSLVSFKLEVYTFNEIMAVNVHNSIVSKSKRSVDKKLNKI